MFNLACSLWQSDNCLVLKRGDQHTFDTDLNIEHGTLAVRLETTHHHGAYVGDGASAGKRVVPHDAARMNPTAARHRGVHHMIGKRWPHGWMHDAVLSKECEVVAGA